MIFLKEFTYILAIQFPDFPLKCLLIFHFLFNPCSRTYSAFSVLNKVLKLRRCSFVIQFGRVPKVAKTLKGGSASTLGVPFIFGTGIQRCPQNKNSAVHVQNSQKAFIRNCRQLLVLSRTYPQNQTRKFVFPVLIRRDFHNIRIKGMVCPKDMHLLYIKINAL